MTAQPIDQRADHPAPIRIALVGHCTPDAAMLRSMLARALPGSAIELVNDEPALRDAKHAGLLLVNRVLDGSFGAVQSGIELIRLLHADASFAGRTMLVSNYPEAQAEAEAVGSHPGFGKSDLYDPETIARVQTAAHGK